jgi:hypothetical protein
MYRIFIGMIYGSLIFGLAHVSIAAEGHQYYEVRSYLLSDQSDSEAIDRYLRDAYLPALGRQGIGPIGVFTNSPDDTSGSPRIVVVIPYESPDQIAMVKNQVAADPRYQADARSLLGRDSSHPAYDRIQSELLIAMDCMPKLSVAANSLSNAQRVYELRTYESPSEHYGDLKVDMFNNGEVPIFLDCGIQPIFIGQGLIGPQTPNLTYLTTYPSESARVKAWEAFKVNPAWQVLKVVQKYKGTVSHIDKYILIPKPYSQM